MTDSSNRGTPVTVVLQVTIVLVIAASFFGTLDNGWADLDDPGNFLSNPHYRGLGLEQLRWMFTTAHMAHYTPLTWMTLGLDHVIWGMNPTGYHATSVLIHVAVALLVYAIALRLFVLAGVDAAVGPCRAGAALAALLFAVHPLRVESVAWVTERRDLVCALFYLAAVLVYLDGRQRPSRWRDVLVLALFAAALLGKSMAVSLPVILLILDVYPLRRLAVPRARRLAEVRALLLEKAPLIVLAAAAAVGAVLAQAHIGNLTPLERFSVGDRIAMSVHGLAFYLWKTLLPVGLSPLYERPLLVDPGAPVYLFAYATVMAVTILAVAMRRRWPALAAAGASYVVVVLPVLAFFHNGPHVNADRYSYLSCLSWALLAGAGAVRAWRVIAMRHARVSLIVPVVMAGVVLTLQAATATQVQVWHDPATLWRQAAWVQPEGGMIQFSLGRALQEVGDLAGAERHYRRVIELNAHSRYYAWNNLGVVLGLRGANAEALAAFLNAVRLDPQQGLACRNARDAARIVGTAPPELALCGSFERPGALAPFTPRQSLRRVVWAALFRGA
jgi:protein O-mannosyl-transferase